MKNKLQKKMMAEIEISPREYLEHCKEHYSDYVSAAHKLFPALYEKFNNDDAGKYIAKAIEFKTCKNIEEEKKFLRLAIDANTFAPYPYERLALLLSEEKDYQNAFKACKNWFNSGFWKLPNAATTSLKIWDRMKKLESKL